jgi:hypothetical protein
LSRDGAFEHVEVDCLTVFILAGDIYKDYMVFECYAGRTSPTPKTAGILYEAGVKAEQSRIKGDIVRSRVFRTRESLEDEDIVLVKLGATVDKGMAMREAKTKTDISRKDEVIQVEEIARFTGRRGRRCCDNA